MQFQKILVPVGVVVLLVVAYREYSWAGVAMALSLVVTWILLHFTRMLQVMKRATNRPIGSVASAVMLNAKLKPGVTLLHVVAMTKSLGALQSPKDSQPEFYRWTDGTQSHVTCEFKDGKLLQWTLERPVQPDTDSPVSGA
nr:glycerate kinase [uncultured Albidiferax sp.]